MSFPKARLLRFNEVSTCAPPPGKYDPKYDQKIKGAVIEKSKRFVDSKGEPAPSVTSQDSASSCSHNYNPAATFRTPQLPRKTRLVATPRSAVERPTSRAQPKQPTPDCKSRKKLDLGYETEQNLIEQINELTRVHTSQLLEKDLELAALQRELADLRAEMSKAEKNHVADYNTMKQSYEKAIEKMKTELEELVKRAEVEKSHTEEFVGELKSKVGVLQQNLDNSNAICNDLEYQLAEANISLVEVKNEYADLEKELKRYKDSINELINRKAKDIESAESSLPEKLEEACAAAQLNVEDLLKKMQESLKALEREIEVERMETHMKFTGVIDSISAEVEDRVELFEQKSKSLQEVIKVMAGEFQSKINDIVDSIAETADINERKLRENLLLTEELEKSKAATVEQKIIVVDLQGKIDELQRKLNQLTSQCRKYEIVQAEATKTIHVLSERLFESETEVERLNDKTEELTLRKDALEGKVKSVVDENNVLKMDINNLQVSLVRGVKEVEMALLAKVESYRRHSVEETQRMKLEVDSKQGTIDMLKNEIEYLRAKAAESAEYLNMCQTRINNYKQEIAAMSQKLATEEMERLANTKIDDLTAENEELSSNIKKLTEDIVDKDLKIGSMAQELEEAKIYNQNLTSRISSLANELEAKESQFDELAQEVEVKNMTMVQVSDEYEKMKEMYENECRKLEVVEQDHITTIALMEAELRQEQSLSLQLGGSLSAMKSKMADIEANAKDLVNIKCTLESKVHDLEQQLSKASEDIKVLTNEKEDLMELVNRQWEERELFSSQIQAQQEEISELKQMRDDRLDEEKAIYQAELQNEIFALQQNLEDTQRHAIDLQGRNDELIFKLNSAESELSAAETEKERHECEVKDLVEKMSSLEVRCAAAEKRKSEYKKYATQLESEKKSLADQLSEVNEEKEKLQDEKRELSMQLTSTSARLADQEIRTRETETRCRELETLAEPTQKQLAAYEAERSAMLEKSTSLENELEALTKVHAKIVGHQNHRQKIHRVQQIIDTNSKLKQENEKLLVENAKLRTALQDAAKKGKSKAFKDVRDKENDSTKCTANPQPPQSPLKVRNAPN